MLRFKLALIGLILLLPVAAQAQAAKGRVGYVDLQRALLEVEDGKSAKNKLKVYFDEKQALLDKRQEDLKKKSDDYQRQRDMLKPEEKGDRERALQQEMMDLQKLFNDLQGELKTREDSATKPIFERMYGIVKEIAERDGYDLILEKNTSGIVYLPEKFDLTNELIREYDKRAKLKK